MTPSPPQTRTFLDPAPTHGSPLRRFLLGLLGTALVLGLAGLGPSAALAAPDPDDPYFTLDTGFVSPTDFVDPEIGVQVSAHGYPAGDYVVEVTDTYGGSDTMKFWAEAPNSGDFFVTIVGDTSDGQTSATYAGASFDVQISDGAEYIGETQTLYVAYGDGSDIGGEFENTTEPTAPSDETAWTWPETATSEGINLTAESYADYEVRSPGVPIAVDGCEPGAAVKVAVARGEETVSESTAKADDAGLAVTGWSSAPRNAEAGDYTVSATCGDTSFDAAFTVTDGTEAADDASAESSVPRGLAIILSFAGLIVLVIIAAIVAITFVVKKSNQPSSDQNMR